MEEPPGKDGARARRRLRVLPPGGVCDGEELGTPYERDLVHSLGLAGLGFPVCKMEVVLRMGKYGA